MVGKGDQWVQFGVVSPDAAARQGKGQYLQSRDPAFETVIGVAHQRHVLSRRGCG